LTQSLFQSIQPLLASVQLLLKRTLQTQFKLIESLALLTQAFTGVTQPESKVIHTLTAELQL
jgi:hypothetical protein